MEIKSILDVSPELASDIQYLWDESNLTSEEIAVKTRPENEKPSLHVWWLGIVQDILGGAYEYEDHKN